MKKMTAEEINAECSEAIKALVQDLYPVVTTGNFQHLTGDQLLRAKTTLRNIHNCATVRLTFALARWLGEQEQFLRYKDKLLQNARQSRPNARGWDLHEPDAHIVAEVKVMSPVNEGDNYGSAQSAGIKKDMMALLGLTPDKEKTVKEKELQKIGSQDFVKVLGLYKSEESQEAAKLLADKVKEQFPTVNFYFVENSRPHQFNTCNNLYVVFLDLDWEHVAETSPALGV